MGGEPRGLPGREGVDDVVAGQRPAVKRDAVGVEDRVRGGTDVVNAFRSRQQRPAAIVGHRREVGAVWRVGPGDDHEVARHHHVGQRHDLGGGEQRGEADREESPQAIPIAGEPDAAQPDAAGGAARDAGCRAAGGDQGVLEEQAVSRGRIEDLLPRGPSVGHAVVGIPRAPRQPAAHGNEDVDERIGTGPAHAELGVRAESRPSGGRDGTPGSRRILEVISAEERATRGDRTRQVIDRGLVLNPGRRAGGPGRTIPDDDIARITRARVEQRDRTRGPIRNDERPGKSRGTEEAREGQSQDLHGFSVHYFDWRTHQ